MRQATHAMIAAVPDAAVPHELTFPSGLPGFPAVRSFECAPWGGEGSDILVLSASEPRAFQFVVVPPAVFFPDYRPEFSADHLASVGIERPDDGAVLVILTLGATAETATANLLGPILLNPRTGQAVQAVQPAGSYNTRAPIVPAA
ncbi:flagellar assembly protein FliW [Acidiferrimicrobium sp. IK]|uniref:flagellar assembly protein FliW n=1 Tax=Acidiferrimicrobium sp. IK TaxID=2871700 RepID=UPI0021CB8141|nr:flagellar assembly protein FliW [Acidiferrimicrobium sp. IK]MCU4185012.1 flagellar assembly protein FliW [Acidiferrimicrobium sp. IK]